MHLVLCAYVYDLQRQSCVIIMCLDLVGNNDFFNLYLNEFDDDDSLSSLGTFM